VKSPALLGGGGVLHYTKKNSTGCIQAKPESNQWEIIALKTHSNSSEKLAEIGLAPYTKSQTA
jgi:hypothetical protein